MTNSAPELAAPSGKSAADENFPVGSLLLPAALRPHVAALYRFARMADDIADSPDLAAGEKIARLDRLADYLLNGDTAEPEAARRMRESLTQSGVPAKHCLDLLDAFRQDATRSRYRDWGQLMAYCARSAAPVGRYLLDLHGEEPALYPASDALCNALQVLNHLQDCAEDYRNLDRVYIPEPWLAAEGIGVESLTEKSADPALRQVLDRMLDGTDALLRDAVTLPRGLRSRRLAMESAAILAIAWRLSALLRRRDPLAGKVKLGRTAYLTCMVQGVWRGLLW